MSELCPTCRRPFPPKVYTIDDAQQIFEILAAQPNGYVYVSNAGAWHVTRTLGMVSPGLVETLRATGDLHNVYKGKDHMAYTLSSRLQIDLDVVAAARHPDFKPPL